MSEVLGIARSIAVSRFREAWKDLICNFSDSHSMDL